MGMSSSERFDVATGVLSVIVLVLAVLERALPWTRFRALEKCLKHAEADLDALWEEGLLVSHNAELFDRLNRFRHQSDRLATRVHAASSVYLQVIEMFKGLSCSLCAVHRRVIALQAEIATYKSAAHASDQERTCAIPASTFVDEFREGRKSRSRSRGPSIPGAHLSKSSSKVAMVSQYPAAPAPLARHSSSSSSISATAHGRANRQRAQSQSKPTFGHRSRSVPKRTGSFEMQPLPRNRSSHISSTASPGLVAINEDGRDSRSSRPGIAAGKNGRGGARSSMFYVPS